MARFLYALSGQGRGHRSRAVAMAETLRRRGHAVRFATSGDAAEALERQGETVVHTPALVQVLDRNRVDLTATVRANAVTVAATPAHIRALADALAAWTPDLVVTDFEPFAPRAAARLGLPVVSLDHQQILTETRLDVPQAHRRAAFWVQWPVRAIAPRHADHRIVSSFFAAPVRRPERTTLVGPILRRAVREAKPTAGDHLLVYTNDSTLGPALLEALRPVRVPARLYGVAPVAGLPSHLTFGPPGDDAAFLADLASCRAVVSTAGHTLLSEALHLGKPVLALPNGGLFEQTLNALMVERLGAGTCLVGRTPDAADVAAFLGRLPTFTPETALLPGHDEAADILEAALARARRPLLAPLSPRLVRTEVVVS